MKEYRAILARSFDGPQDVTVGSAERKPLGTTEARIAVKAAGVNFADLMSVIGTHQDNPPPPFVPGFEIAGEIIELGADTFGLSVGDRVMSGADYGAFADEIVVDYRLCATLPDDASYAEGAAMPVAFGTGYTGLVQRGRLRAGQWLLVMGAGGNIGGGALQIGQLLAARTIAPGGGAEGCERLMALGADHVFDYRDHDVAEQVRAITDGHGADVIFDAVTGKAFGNTHAALARLGRHVTAGAAGGEPPDAAMMPLITNSAALVGVDWQHFVRLEPDVAQEALGTVARWWKRGWIKPPRFATRPLEEARSVIEDIAEGKVREKIVLTTE